MSQRQAMSYAIEAFRSPSRFRSLSRDPLPPGMLTVIKAAAGDEATLAESATASSLDKADIQEAAKHYLFQVLLDADGKDLRLLGLCAGADPKNIKDHKRWLLKWLHPDRNPSTWEQALFLKISNFKESPQHEDLASFTLHHQAEVRTTPKSMPPKMSRQNRRRSWTTVERRAPLASPWRVLLRMAKPLVASLFLVTMLVWIVSLNNQSAANPLSWLSVFYKG